MKTNKRTVYFNSYDDDFAGTDIKQKPVTADFPFVHKNIFWRAGAFVVYCVIARPVVNVLCRLRFGLRIKNRKAIRAAKKTGFFLYGNHTQAFDVFIPTIVAYPHRAYIVANADSVSIPGLKNIIQMLGAVPVPNSGIHGLIRFVAALELRYAQKGCVAVYPEAHIWPYYTGVRPFQSQSFTYPVKLGSPVFAMASTYRRRRFLGHELKPGWTVTVSEAMYPDGSKKPREACEDLCRQVYSFLEKEVISPDNYEYIRYIRATDEADSQT